MLMPTFDLLFLTILIYMINCNHDNRVNMYVRQLGLWPKRRMEGVIVMVLLHLVMNMTVYSNKESIFYLSGVVV